MIAIADFLSVGITLHRAVVRVFLKLQVFLVGYKIEQPLLSGFAHWQRLRLTGLLGCDAPSMDLKRRRVSPVEPALPDSLYVHAAGAAFRAALK